MHWQQIFYLCNTVYPILAGTHQVTSLNFQKANPHQPLCSFDNTTSKSYCYLASQDPNTLCISPTSHAFSKIPAYVVCHSLYARSAITLSLTGLLPTLSSLLHYNLIVHCEKKDMHHKNNENISQTMHKNISHHGKELCMAT